MTLSLYAATVPTFLQILPSVSAWCDKGAAWCREQGLADSELTQARLADDMWPLANQLRSVWTHSADAIEGVQRGETGPGMAEPTADFASLKSKINDAITRLREVRPETIDALIGKDTHFRFGDRAIPFTVEDYLLSFALPNFFFHATTAYAIMRSRGVRLGKADFLGGLRLKG